MECAVCMCVCVWLRVMVFVCDVGLVWSVTCDL